MADETEGKTGKSEQEERAASLIERAAERLASDGRRGQKRKTAPGAEGPASSSTRTNANSPQQVAPQVERELRTEAVGRQQEMRRRRSKLVTIASEGLAARGIMRPGVERSRTIEEFRLIKRMVLSRRWEAHGGSGNTIIVTSALPAEGKTTTAINLAMSITAEEDLHAVLVDADFIKPDALRQLGVSAKMGLVDVLRDPGMDIGDVMLRTNIDKLSLIPAGQLDNRCTELLASARMDALIKELSNRYEDRILIFDSPPILATTESVVLTTHMGQVVFVVQAGRTKRESVNSALELIGECPNLGLVLNRTTRGFGKTDFGSYYDSYYYYGYGGKKELDGQTAA